MPPHAASPRPHPGRDMEAPGDTEHWQLMVALRIRPLSAAELEEGASPIAHRLGEQVVVLRDPMEDPEDVLRANRSREKSYVFDAAFDSTATQETVYRATTRGLIASIISGCNATVFAYGPTGCGKTYTMLGTDREPGIYARTLGDLFQAIEDTSGDMDYEVSMSYLEIYNETIRDLLNPSLGYLELREDSKGAIQVAGITEVSAVNAEEVMQLLLKGNKQRTQEPTAANRASSRSHAVLQVSVRQRSRRAGAVRRGRLFLIDLAGSERAAQSQNRGQRMREGAHINRSLLALGNCINALSAKASQKYVNYRDSKLTRLLKDSLGGNSRTVMIAHISPASTAFEESRSTLAYADRARSIRTSVRRNLLGASHGMVQYGSIVADLRREIRRLQSRLGAEPGRPGQGERGDIRCIQAPVRLQGDAHPELGRLRRELRGACREQEALRRCLLELEGTALHARREASRHLLTLARWDQKRLQGRRRSEGERKEPYGPGDSERDSDTGDDRSDVPESPDLAAARESIAALVEEQSRLREHKAELERCFQESRERARRLEQTLPRWSSSAEQREVLALLRRLHELQLENAATQSRTLLEGGLPQPPAAVLQRLDRHRALCARIIQQQRQLIADHRLPVPRRLQELYETYRQQRAGGPERGGAPKVRPLGPGARPAPTPLPPAQGPSLPSISPASDQRSAGTRGPRHPAPRRGDALPALLPGARSGSEAAPPRTPASGSTTSIEDGGAAGTAARCPDTWVQARKKGGKKPGKRDEPPGAQRRTRRSRSFEVAGCGLGGPEAAAPRPHVLQSSSEHTVPAGHWAAPAAAMPAARVPQSPLAGPGGSALPTPLRLRVGVKTGWRR
ncbi:kinesin-like protein KIF19 isoform X2 [Dromaius novaehollandiae]|uniref:kinesin-like protein KIF19 isoform X2 n=1 Tax=Dromaius novaehollandiae TaxID=8790 RepID=UPI00311DDC9D